MSNVKPLPRRLLMAFKLGNIITKRDFQYLVILSFFIFLSSRALFHDGFYRTVDDITTVRIDYMEKELRRNNWINNFPVRLSGELSNYYGYPLYLFYAPLIYYVGAFLKIFLSLSNIVATKYVYVFPLLFGPIAFYFAARQKMSPFPALISSIFFTLFPYRGYNTYILGAAPQAWAMSFIPAAMGGLFLLQKKKAIGGTIFCLSFFLILISHNLTGMLFGGFLLLFGFLFLLKNIHFWKYLILSLGLSAFFLLPMLYYLKIVRVTQIPINTTFILKTLEPLSNSFKIFNLDKITLYHDPAYKFSAIFLLILIGGLGILYYEKLKGKKTPREFWFWGIIGLVFYLSLFQPSAFLWRLTMPITGILQFVWRLLALLAFIIPLFLGLSLARLKGSFAKSAIAFASLAAAMSFLPVFKPYEYSFFYDYRPSGSCETSSFQDEYLPVWVKTCKPGGHPFYTESPSQIASITKNNHLYIEGEIDAQQEADLLVSKIYFPGWHLYIDGQDKPLEWNFSQAGIFKTSISAGKHNILAVYKKTPIMWLADLISITSAIIMLYLGRRTIVKIIRVASSRI